MRFCISVVLVVMSPLLFIILLLPLKSVLDGLAKVLFILVIISKETC